MALGYVGCHPVLAWDFFVMVTTVPDVLARIVAQKRLELPALERRRAGLERRIEQARATRRHFLKALNRQTPAIIAELKKASPSKGVLCADFQPSRIARLYEAGGAAALSVLTDADFFQGSLADLEAARAATQLPVLRKDFTLEEIHVIEAAAAGADAILLIAAILTERQLRSLRELAESFDMAALVEVHDESELERAVASGAALIGVNNRNLHTFEVNLDTALRLAERMPDGVVRVSESGIRSRADIEQLQRAGYQAFLVGEHLMRAAEPALALRRLLL